MTTADPETPPCAERNPERVGPAHGTGKKLLTDSPYFQTLAA
jgi:hypothetical protein